jgi:hypothetical protein
MSESPFKISGVMVKVEGLDLPKTRELVYYAISVTMQKKIGKKDTTASILQDLKVQLQPALVEVGPVEFAFIDPESGEDAIFEHYPTLALCIRSTQILSPPQ